VKDLPHVLHWCARTPLFWAAVLDLRIEVWLAHKIARMARKLSKDR